MGGQSYRCPLCELGHWFMTQRALRDHLRGKHGLTGVNIRGVGDNVRIIGANRREPKP